MSAAQKNILGKLLLHTQGRARLRVALAVLCIGAVLLLLSVLAWWDFSMLLQGGSRTETSTYMVIGKQITERTMGLTAANTFSQQEIADVQKAPQVQQVGAVTPARFPVYATIGGQLAMATDLPLEAVPDAFIDNLPADWRWQPGERDLPVILSSQFLDVYNYVFAPGQGLPQLSRQSVKAIALRLQVGGPQGQVFSAHVVGFSDRLGSVIVPQSFIDYGNHTFGTGQPVAPSQLVLRVNDPSDTKFTAYLTQHSYEANPQNLRWSRMRAIVEAVTTATGLIALLLMGISALVFTLFIELTITRAQVSLQLLLQLGYSTSFLRRFVAGRFLPLVAASMVVALLLCMVVQYAIATQVRSTGLELPVLPGWQVFAAFAASIILLSILVLQQVRRAVTDRP